MPSSEIIIPAEAVYGEVEHYWDQLSQLFPRAQRMPTPRVVFSHDFGNQTSYLIPELAGKSPTQDGLYLPRLHAVILNAENPNAATPLVVSEETTHAATFVQGDLNRPASSFRDFNGYEEGFGERLVKQAERIGLPVVPMDVNEFFAPIGQAILLGDAYVEDWGWGIAFPESPFSSPVSDRERALFSDILHHLPRLAGELLVKGYDKDIRKLVFENADLFQAIGHTVWENYCVPLLQTGKLK